MFKLIKVFILEVWYNPKEGFRMVWLVIGTISMLIFGCIGIGVHECGKIMLDKTKKKG